ncbi:MAG: hypothetical protein AB7H70_12185 [Rhodospirillaceae bacterium]
MVFRGIQLAVIGAASSAVLLAFSAPAYAVQSQSYVVNWFAGAANTQPDNCVGGINPPLEDQFHKELLLTGMLPVQADKVIKDYLNNENGHDVDTAIRYRGRYNGRPVNVFNNPQTIPDPKMKAVVGKAGYGFNLDGKGADDPKAFQDPETLEKGVDNQLFRAVGCLEGFRGSLANHPTFWYWIWQTIRDSQPAWLVTVSGDDLTKDGPVTFTFDRALEYMVSNSGGEARADVTYRIDPDPRSHNVFKGEIKNGVAYVTEHGNFKMLQNSWGVPELNIRNFHMRMKINKDRSMEAILGGYQPWHHLYFAFAHGGLSRETSTGSLAGIYHLLKNNADADPDPKTGQNRAISSSYHMKAVPVFAVQPEPPKTTPPKPVASVGGPVPAGR